MAIIAVHAVHSEPKKITDPKELKSHGLSVQYLTEFILVVFRYFIYK